MKNKSLISIYLIVILAISFPVYGQQEKRPSMITDRPDFTESAATVMKGLRQFEFGYTVSHTGPVKDHTIGEFLIRMGMLDNFELRLGFNSYVISKFDGQTLSGLEDFVVSTKTILSKGESSGMPAAAILVASSFPTGSPEFKHEHIQPTVKLALAWELTDIFSLGSNVNFAYLSEGDEQFSQFGGSLSLGIGLTGVIGAYAEYFGFNQVEKDGDVAHFINGGFTFLIKNNFQLDARAGLGLNDIDDEYFLGTGAAVRF